MEILASRVLFRPADYQRSVRFYRDEVGLAIAREYGAGTVFYAGQSLIELAGHGAPPDGAPPFPGALWLQVRDLVEEHRRLVEAGVTVVRPPEREPWGLLEMWIEDPDGVPIVLVEVPEDHPLRRDQR